MQVTTPISDVPSLIRTLRQRLNLSQEKLAASLGVSFQTVNRWERGHAKPSQLALNAIEQKLAEMGGQGMDLRNQYFHQQSDN
ncbi:MAG: helix-turn-helix transcriptional regulator [Cyanobacteriota bacterium]|nr:helix-turn-helix transcriptional regulator [Cyanobacteriota bacterium]